MACQVFISSVVDEIETQASLPVSCWFNTKTKLKRPIAGIEKLSLLRYTVLGVSCSVGQESSQSGPEEEGRRHLNEDIGRGVMMTCSRFKRAECFRSSERSLRA